MATPSDLALLHSAGLGCPALEAAPHDILIAVQGEDPDSIGQAVDQAERGAGSQPINDCTPAVVRTVWSHAASKWV